MEGKQDRGNGIRGRGWGCGWGWGWCMVNGWERCRWSHSFIQLRPILATLARRIPISVRLDSRGFQSWISRELSFRGQSTWFGWQLWVPQIDTQIVHVNFSYQFSQMMTCYYRRDLTLLYSPIQEVLIYPLFINLAVPTNMFHISDRKLLLRDLDYLYNLAVLLSNTHHHTSQLLDTLNFISTSGRSDGEYWYILAYICYEIDF